MSWQPIEEQTLSAPASSIVFNTGLAGYDFYRLTVYVLNDSNAKRIYVRLNADSGANYDLQDISGASTSVAGERITSHGQIDVSRPQTLSANNAGSFSCIIAKPAVGVPAQVVGVSGLDAAPELQLYGAGWDNTADAISSITILNTSGDFAAGTSALLEGLAA